MQSQMSDHQIQANYELVCRITDKFSSPRRESVKSMLFDSPVGTSFFLAPASTRVEFHSCFTGGLCDHSLRVVKNLKKLTAALCDRPDIYSLETLLFVGLFHDLGKTGDGVRELYTPKESDWHRRQGIMYDINPLCSKMSTAEMGLYLLQKHGIPVSEEEYLAIRLNDGQYDPANQKYAMREPPLALLVHWADRWSVEQEKSVVQTVKGPAEAT